MTERQPKECPSIRDSHGVELSCPNHSTQTTSNDEVYLVSNSTCEPLRTVESNEDLSNPCAAKQDACQQVFRRPIRILSYGPIYGVAGARINVRVEVLDQSLQICRFMVVFGTHPEWAKVNLCRRGESLEAYVTATCPVLQQRSTQYPLALRICNDEIGLFYDENFGTFTYHCSGYLPQSPDIVHRIAHLQHENTGLGVFSHVQDGHCDEASLPGDRSKQLMQRSTPFAIPTTTSPRVLSHYNSPATEQHSLSSPSSTAELSVSKNQNLPVAGSAKSVQTNNLLHNSRCATESESLAPRNTMRTTVALMPIPQQAGTVTDVSEVSSSTFDPYSAYANKAVLKIDGDLESMAHDWNDTEHSSGRRLVEFRRKQSGKTITISPKPVMLSHRAANSFCVSCIYWKEKGEAYVTSVDTIHLLQCIVGIRFTVEEKNRIRRNLEGFQPLTVSKTKPDCGEFFSLVMGFPYPKPRNIEKDVKVFPWKKLGIALKKIIGKYSATPTSTARPSAATTVGLSRQPEPQVPRATEDRHNGLFAPDPDRVFVRGSRPECHGPFVRHVSDMTNSGNDEPVSLSACLSNMQSPTLEALRSDWTSSNAADSGLLKFCET